MDTYRRDTETSNTLFKMEDSEEDLDEKESAS